MGVVLKMLQWLFLPWLTRRFKNLVEKAKSHDTGRASFEVERKYPISKEEFHDMPRRLRSLGFLKMSEAVIVDTFVPAEKDGDMIRVRQETTDNVTTTVITLKQWVEVAGGREREERESRPIDAVASDCVLALGRRLSKEELMSFSKDRTTFSGVRDKRKVNVALDVTSGIGQYSGTYLEVEVIVEDEDGVAEARGFVEAFAKQLVGDEREQAISYMEMLKKARKEMKH